MIEIKPIKTLESERLILREFENSDAENLYNTYGTDKEITKYMLWKNYETIEDAIKAIEFYKKTYNENSNYRQYAIVLKNTNELIGQISFTINTKHESAELGYLIARKFQNNGYMSEAINRLIDYLTNELKCTRISAEVMTDNKACIKLLEKYGFKKEGTFLKKYKKDNKHFVDIIEYAIIKIERT